VKHNRHNKDKHKRHEDFIPWFGQVQNLPTPRCGVPMDESCTQLLSSDPMINLNTTMFFLLCSFPVCEADRWRFGAVGAPDTVRCTPDSPVPPPFRPLAQPRVSHGSRGRPLARPTVGSPDSPVHTGQSGEF
jgi:hypothetical protein